MSEVETLDSGFAVLNLPENLSSALDSLGFKTPTPIQLEAIPHLLEGRDLLGEAQTGTGKTAAFGLPALALIDPSVRKTQLMVLAPTRELAIQVAEAIESFAKHMRGLRVATVYGGQSYGPQLAELERGPQVIVATPGRLMDHIRRGRIKFDDLKTLVLDEADEMLNMGFLEDVEWIMSHVPETTQMALFSATMPPAIRKITERFLKNPAHVKIAVSETKKANIRQRAWEVRGINKLTALERLVETVEYDAMLVFVRTRNDTVELAERLESQGFKASALNGDMNQQMRERTVNQLKEGKINILVATDVVARGLDVPRISHVLNFDLPDDHESYVHRIGRTGRAGRSGEALLFVRPRERYLLRHYMRATGGDIESMELPSPVELGAHRQEKCREELTKLVDNPNLEAMREMINAMAEQSETSVLDLAAALLYKYQQKRPLQPKPDPERPQRDTRGRNDRFDRNDRGGQRNGRGRNERGGQRFDRNDRGGDRPPRARQGQGRRNDIDWKTYRLAVGRDHGVQVKDIVGAIANEASIDSGNIGAIRLFDGHSTVQLPSGMPAEVFSQLSNARVRNKPMGISADTGGAPRPRPRNQESRADA
ncbi:MULTISPECIES: DEAD/DEAH box helicase [Corallincola]|uniref:ATP-dependent RNA helicase DeaD n=3 Tax=Corallincola TaxID=1775176 RepID=A0A368NS70_9GAMM|nr:MULTISPECIES: DEAD/DEAH box helicase [Corallincola]RCU52960.1 ATP-dependent helicase [Corallincola holothuriorum]TAA47989.1 DEAD/DEAH box helicase [Corallincola spongiicola]TCI03357.1 DEAD/DEAH box helicase [Corallincola luteus]